MRNKKLFCALLLTIVTVFPVLGQIRTLGSANFTKFTVASWNIGHFALGKKKNTTINYKDAEKRQKIYREFVNNVDADIFCVEEFNPEFVMATDSAPAIFARYAVLAAYDKAMIGKKYDYNCNAVFSNGFKILGSEEKWFSVMVQKRYYLVVNMLLDGDVVKVVSTHLDWNEKEKGEAYRKQQMQELIDAFKNDKYVIFSADWNAGTGDEYDVFAKAGYQLANHGFMGGINTCGAGPNPSHPCDNIIVKGFSVNNVEVENRPDLTDHMLIKATLTKMR